MRPGQLTPENAEAARIAGLLELASMRPGQLTPENFMSAWITAPARRCFNEAGAINPGKPNAGCAATDRAKPASMRPGQLTPENVRKDRQDSRRGRASMRPGQLTPENNARQVKGSV